MKSDFTFKASDGEKIAVTTFGDSGHRRCAIYVHGFKGFKDWGFAPYLGEFLSGRDIFTVTFNFSHNGIGDDMQSFDRLDKFKTNTYSRELRELREMIAATLDGEFGQTACDRVGLLGHSRGGAVTLLTAPQVPEVKAAVTWSAIATVDRYSETLVKQWRENGQLEVKNARTGQMMPLGLELLEDIENNRTDRLNIEKAVRKLDKPLLIIHGEDDEGVPPSEADRINSWADNAELLKVSGAGHTFNATHPFKGSNEKLDHVLDRTASFFEKHL